MELTQTLNLIGLLLITYGSISAAYASPAPRYQSDGSVYLSGEPDQKKRIAIHKRQKRFPNFLMAIGFGAALQAIALIVGAL
ncbi:hypothetical protein FKG94_03020 [Exilibacterium tricleocarpae]|uniref:Uncharacterized protein n=1 Tax=Exilibacterium tricleocarpae TaxID=2591008 RepID=A0A545U6T2_9GAMM|nr:hypothetical protein [Exilibacterium tricleocarpae]TQV85175.1 hypothetical protein FKG94_03020 [Exilibacterium tricleocarpae]